MSDNESLKIQKKLEKQQKLLFEELFLKYTDLDKRYKILTTNIDEIKIQAKTIELLVSSESKLDQIIEMIQDLPLERRKNNYE